MAWLLLCAGCSAARPAGPPRPAPEALSDPTPAVKPLSLVPDRVILSGTASLKGPRFLSTAHRYIKSEAEAPLSRLLRQRVDIDEWKDSENVIVTPGVAFGWDLDDVWEIFFEFTYAADDLKTHGRSGCSFGLVEAPWVDTGPVDYRFNITRENTAIGLGPAFHIGDFLNRFTPAHQNWLGRRRFDPYLMAIGTYNWASSDFEADIRMRGADVSAQLGLPDGSALVPASHERVREHNTGKGPGVALAAGFHAPLSRSWDLTAMFRYSWTHLDGRGAVDFDLSQWTASVGLAYTIGRPRYGPGDDRWRLLRAVRQALGGR